MIKRISYKGLVMIDAWTEDVSIIDLITYWKESYQITYRENTIKKQLDILNRILKFNWAFIVHFRAQHFDSRIFIYDKEGNYINQYRIDTLGNKIRICINNEYSCFNDSEMELAVDFLNSVVTKELKELKY